MLRCTIHRHVCLVCSQDRYTADPAPGWCERCGGLVVAEYDHDVLLNDGREPTEPEPVRRGRPTNEQRRQRAALLSPVP